MKKLLLLTIIVLSIFSSKAIAEKIPIKIEPTRIISTHNDEIELGDWIPFSVINDIYVKDKLYIKKGEPIYGFVDFFHPNGWAGDNAEIRFKKFQTKNIYGKEITINYPLDIDGNSAKANDLKVHFVSQILIIFRGAEIFIEPDTKMFNLFIERL